MYKYLADCATDYGLKNILYPHKLDFCYRFLEFVDITAQSKASEQMSQSWTSLCNNVTHLALQLFPMNFFSKWLKITYLLQLHIASFLKSPPFFVLNFLNVLLSRPKNESAYYSQNSSRSFSSPQASSHSSALNFWPQGPSLGGGLSGPHTSSVAPGSQRTCQVQHGLQPKAQSWDGSSWGWSTEYRCREEQREG